MPRPPEFGADGVAARPPLVVAAGFPTERAARHAYGRFKYELHEEFPDLDAWTITMRGTADDAFGWAIAVVAPAVQPDTDDALAYALLHWVERFGAAHGGSDLEPGDHLMQHIVMAYIARARAEARRN
jgi:hypothetical protein